MKIYPGEALKLDREAHLGRSAQVVSARDPAEHFQEIRACLSARNEAEHEEAGPCCQVTVEMILTL